eukprot:10332354-Alexandrium_andersonii.AAC.1
MSVQGWDIQLLPELGHLERQWHCCRTRGHKLGLPGAARLHLAASLPPTQLVHRSWSVAVRAAFC